MSLVVLFVTMLLAVWLFIAVVGLVIKLLWFLLIGLVVGALARLVLPGEQRIGTLGTALAGAAGALGGGLVASLLDLGFIAELGASVLLAALVVAVVAGTSASTD